MTLPTAPPRYASWSELLAPIKRDEKNSWRVFALQSALVSVGRTLVVDGDFGDRTFTAVKGFQSNNDLVADGIAGPATQVALIDKVSHVVHDTFDDLPDGLLRGYAEAEGANILAATNWFTPIGGAAGVDCGPVQWRQYGPPFRMEGMKAAFDCKQSFLYASDILFDRQIEYQQRRPSLKQPMLLRLALLAHNAPFLAEQVVRNGKLSTPNALATWTIIPEADRSKYGGRTSYTHAEWMQVYPDRLMKYATWPS